MCDLVFHMLEAQCADARGFRETVRVEMISLDVVCAAMLIAKEVVIICLLFTT